MESHKIISNSVDVDELLTHPRLEYFYSPIEREAIRLLNETPETRHYFLSDALERYLTEHKRGRDIRFTRDTRRAIGIVTMKDLLRNSGCSEEMAKALLGHGTRSISDQYGAGFSLLRLKEAMEKIVVSL